MVHPSPENPDVFNPDVFEDHVKDLLEKNYGCEVTKPPKNQHGHDLEIKRNGKSIAVRCKNLKRTVDIRAAKKFTEYMGLFRPSLQFSEGWLISSAGFAKPPIAYLSSQPGQHVVSLGTIRNGDIDWDYRHPKNSFSPLGNTGKTPAAHQSKTHPGESRRYFGIFTNKGGTGKTTVAAHLAGAFALIGYDVILLDIDPQKNLKKLFQNDNYSSLSVDCVLPEGSRKSATIRVLDDKQWEDVKGDFNDVKIVICDYNPTFEKNPNDLVKQFDYCVIPTTLNPLGIAKNSDVIKRTFDQIRTKNYKAEMFVLINHCNHFQNQKCNKKP